jgi:hypothetical protein
MRDLAIRNIHLNVVTIHGETDAFDAGGNEVVLDENKISAEITRLQAEYDAQEYARNRKSDYPDIGDQLDALYHAGVFPANMAARIKETKDKYPK